MSHCVRFNTDWMSEDQYKALLTSVPEYNRKAKCKLCAKPFSLSNMGEQALKRHATGKKHITFMAQTQKNDPVIDFFTVKCGTHLEHLVQQAMENQPYH